ncbi:ComF family protein [Mycobacterium sp. ML4]
MTNADAAYAQIKQSLLNNAGGYLRNTVPIVGETCANCRGARMKDGEQTCFPCAFFYDSTTADLVGSMVYAVGGSQSNKLMRGYKDTPPSSILVQRVTSLISLGVKAHFDCAERLLGGSLSRWATVPSLKTIGSVHPLRSKILTPMLGEEYEIEVLATEKAKGKTEKERRVLDPEFYAVNTAVPHGAHVLLIDDTWTTGGHIQSVAKALKQAGAAKVAALSVARWMDPYEPRTKRVLVEHFKDRPYDPDVCPWTGGSCP